MVMTERDVISVKDAEKIMLVESLLLAMENEEFEPVHGQLLHELLMCGNFDENDDNPGISDVHLTKDETGDESPISMKDEVGVSFTSHDKRSNAYSREDLLNIRDHMDPHIKFQYREEVKLRMKHFKAECQPCSANIWRNQRVPNKERLSNRIFIGKNKLSLPRITSHKLQRGNRCKFFHFRSYHGEA
ncbi:hypothetical protein L1049_013792 [Liquidambar formosana]|uniref:Uncharacterized protein n=1 Tax=Liquidambar formosana TaxID=63359 RepID=A0AAP0WX50_LIQFO